MTSDYSRTFACSVLLWFRRDISRADAQVYWRGPHAQLVARTHGFQEYRQHHFLPTGDGCFPTIASVETKIPQRRRIDGMPEVILDGLLAPLRSRKQNKRVFADEANVFARTILYAGKPGDGRSYRLDGRGKVASRSVLLLRRRAGVSRRAFAAFLDNVLAPYLLAPNIVCEFRTQHFLPWKQSQWPTPGVAHDNPPGDQFHASVIVGFADDADRRAYLTDAMPAEIADSIRTHCSAVHGYEVEATYAYVVEGRVTLPQRGPVAKPAIDPVKRRLAPPPARASRNQSEMPFPPSELIPLGGHGTEDVVADADGHLICGLASGRIIRIDPITRAVMTVGDTHGRPLGLEVLHDGRILICDARRGLLRLDLDTEKIEVLVETIDDIPLRFCSNVVAARDGTCWFTESTSRFDFEDFAGAMLEHRPSGRLFRRDVDGTVTTLLEGLHFANGLTLAENEAFLIFAETDGYTLSRLWLAGHRKGEREVIVDNLPGFPDNLSACLGGRFWVALPNARNPSLDRAGVLPGWLRRLFWRRMPSPAPVVRGPTWVMQFDTDGALVADYQVKRNDFFGATGVVETNRQLFIAGVDCDDLLACDLRGT